MSVTDAAAGNQTGPGADFRLRNWFPGRTGYVKISIKWNYVRSLPPFACLAVCAPNSGGSAFVAHGCIAGGAAVRRRAQCKRIRFLGFQAENGESDQGGEEYAHETQAGPPVEPRRKSRAYDAD